MPGKRRVYGAPFKAQVALAAAKGDRTTAQVADLFADGAARAGRGQRTSTAAPSATRSLG